MIRVHILVEGQTEESFVRELLVPHFAKRQIYLSTVLATTKRVKVGPYFRGGITSFGKVQNDIWRLLRDSSASAVTTMIDFYGLPTDFPGVADLPQGNCYARVVHIQTVWAEAVGDPRFLPFLILHEFEALLFSKPESAAYYFPESTIVDQMAAIATQYGSPEEINEGPTTHPAHRLQQLAPTYQKTLHGPLLAMEMGLAAIRGVCPHFDRWLTQIEQL